MILGVILIVGFVNVLYIVRLFVGGFYAAWVGVVCWYDAG